MRGFFESSTSRVKMGPPPNQTCKPPRLKKPPYPTHRSLCKPPKTLAPLYPTHQRVWTTWSASSALPKHMISMGMLKLFFSPLTQAAGCRGWTQGWGGGQRGKGRGR